MDVSVTTIGAIIGLIVAIVIIIVGINPSYGMIFGAIVGGLIGGAGLEGTLKLVFSGASGMSVSLLRIMAAGVMAGVLIESGGAERISNAIVKKLGDRYSIAAVAFSTWLLTAIGVFGDISCLTVAPIALSIGRKTGCTKSVLVIALMGGLKSGNVMSPNPQTIALAEYFNIPLTNAMIGGIIPSLFGVFTSIAIAMYLHKRKFGPTLDLINENEILHEQDIELTFFQAIIGPIFAIGLLALRPLLGINLDPLLVLPIGGIIGTVAAGKGFKEFIDYSTKGLNRMSGVILLLLGTGAIAGVIKGSDLNQSIITFVENAGIPSYLLAPIAGIAMGLATASSTAGSTVASQVFGPAILKVGTTPLQAAVMIQAGSNVFDAAPHGSIFHVSAQSVNLSVVDRLKIYIVDIINGLVMTIVATIIFGVMGLTF